MTGRGKRQVWVEEKLRCNVVPMAAFTESAGSY